MLSSVYRLRCCCTRLLLLFVWLLLSYHVDNSYCYSFSFSHTSSTTTSSFVSKSLSSNLRHRRLPIVVSRSKQNNDNSHRLVLLKKRDHLLFKIRGGGDQYPIGTSLSLSSSPLGSLVSSIMMPTTSIMTCTNPSIGLGLLFGYISAVCIAMTQYKNLYGISVGYGTSVALVGYLLLQKGSSSLLTLAPNMAIYATIFYGIRLALYLLIRDILGMQERTSNRPEPNRISRIPFALSVAVFYTLLTTPLFYFVRYFDPTAVYPIWVSVITWIGIVMAWFGATTEAIADLHKFIVKRRYYQKDKVNDATKVFHGPTTWLYTITRHPNYTGEILFWLGSYLFGLPTILLTIISHHSSISLTISNLVVGLVGSTLGLLGIVQIMTQATKRLEERQKENYSDQSLYQQWKLDTIP